MFFPVLLLGETLDTRPLAGAAMVLGSAMLAEFVHPRKCTEGVSRPPPRKCKTSG